MAQQVIAFKHDGSLGLSEPVETSSPTSRPPKSKLLREPVRTIYQHDRRRKPISPVLKDGEDLSGEEDNPELMKVDPGEERSEKEGQPEEEARASTSTLIPSSPTWPLQSTSALNRSTGLQEQEVAEEDEEEVVRRPRSRKHGSRAQRIVQAESDVEATQDEGEESDEVVRSSIRKGKAKARPLHLPSSEDDFPGAASVTRTSSFVSSARQEKSLNLSKKSASQQGNQSSRRQQSDDDIFGGKSFVVLIESPRKKVSKAIVISDTESESSSEEVSTHATSRLRTVSHTSHSTQKRRKTTSTPSLRQRNAKKSEKSVGIVSSDSDLLTLGEFLARKSTKPAQPSTREKKRAPPPPSSSSSTHSKESDMDDFIDEDDDSLMGKRYGGSSSERETEVAKVRKNAKVKKLSSIVKAARKRSKGSADEVSGESDVNDFIASEGEESSSGGEERRRRKKAEKVRKAKKRARKEAGDNGEQEDEDDLELSGRETVLKERFRNRKSSPSKFELLRAARQKRLEHQGSPATPSVSHSSHIDSASEDEDSQDSASSSIAESSADDSDLDGNLHGLIDEELEEDEEGKKLVAEFRNDLASQAQGLRYYLKTYIQWIIRIIICPEIDWLEEHKDYLTAYRVVEDSSRSLLNSLIGSMAWRIPYKEAITALPNFQLEDLMGGERGCACDACSMGGSRHATFKLTLEGDKYDRKTFRPEETSSSAEEDSDEEREDFGRTWNLGTNCAGRSEVYSELTHAGFHLYEELFLLLAPVRKIYPKMKLPATSSRKAFRGEHERMVKLNQTEAERLTVLFEEQGTVNKLADEWMKRVDDAKRDFTER